MYGRLSGCVGCGLSSVPSEMMMDALANKLQQKYLLSANNRTYILPDAVAGLKQICPDTLYTVYGIEELFLAYWKTQNYAGRGIGYAVEKTAYKICSESQTAKPKEEPKPKTEPKTKPDEIRGTVICADGVRRLPPLCPEFQKMFESEVEEESDNTLLYVGLGVGAIILYAILKK